MLPGTGYRWRTATGQNWWWPITESQVAGQAQQAQDEAHRVQSEVILFTEHVIPPGAPFASIMKDLGIDASMAGRLVSSAQSVFNLRRLRAGNRVAVGRSVMGELRAIRYRIDTGRMLWISPKGANFQAEIQKTRAGDFHRLAPFGDIQLCRHVGRQLARIHFSRLGQAHQRVGLIIAEARVGARTHQHYGGVGVRQDGGHGLLQPLFENFVKHGRSGPDRIISERNTF